MHRSDRPAAGAATAATGSAAVADGESDRDGTALVEHAIGQLRSAVDTLARVDETTLPDDCLARAVRALAAVDGRLEGLQARLTRAATAAGVPERSGATSTTDWLRTTTGRSGRHASRTDRMARTMDDAPELAARLSTGAVGPDQADRIARGLDRGTLEPTDATDLLRHATHLPPGPFDREAKRLEGRRHQRRLREQEQAAHRARSASRWRDPDDGFRLDVRLAPADGDVVDKALNAFMQPDAADVPDGERRTPRQVRADALVDMSRTVLQHALGGEVGGVRPQCSVIVGPEMLLPLEEAEALGATGTTDLDTVLSAAAAQQLLCDATFRRIVVDARGQVLDVGRATRKWSGAVRAAITALDGGDRTPGSELPPERCDIHHITFWEQGGGTSTANGVLLGKRGHDMVHVEGWRLTMDPVTRVCTWTSPDGATTLTTHPRGAAARGAGAPHDIPALRAVTGRGGRPDGDPAVDRTPDRAPRRDPRRASGRESPKSPGRASPAGIGRASPTGRGRASPSGAEPTPTGWRTRPPPGAPHRDRHDHPDHPDRTDRPSAAPLTLEL